MGERSARLVLLRHGESLWNQEGRFTGWMDIDLSEKGRLEAREAGRLMHNSGFVFHMAYTSVLKRAIRTLWLVLDEMDLMWIPTYPSWRLNERSYGDLQGRKKLEADEIYGMEQVHRWRRGFREHPPAISVGDERFREMIPDTAIWKWIKSPGQNLCRIRKRASCPSGRVKSHPS